MFLRNPSYTSVPQLAHKVLPNMKIHRFAFVGLALLVPLGAARAQVEMQSQEGIALQNQILQLQQQVQQLQSSGGNVGSSLGNSGPGPAPSAAPTDPGIVGNLLNQVNQLQSQVQELNGKVDTLQNQVSTEHDTTEKEIGDLKFQMTNGGQAGAPNTSSTPPTGTLAPPAGAPAQIEPQASDSAADLLHQGEQAYAKKDYATAEGTSHAVLAKSKTGPLAYRAQFLLAQSLAGENKPQDAAIAYDDAYNKDRSGTYASQSLLGLASSLLSLNQNEAACDTLSSLNSQFPNPGPSLASRISATSRRAHCH